MSLRVLALAALLPCLTIAADWDPNKIQGSPTAPIAIEIYSSFDCPHCAFLHATMVPQILHDMVATGRACVISREYPLPPPAHKYAHEAANLATAAARIGKYQIVADTLFKNQAVWAEAGKVWDVVAAVLSPSEQAKVKALANDPGVIAEVERDYNAAVSAGLNQTPTLMVIQQKTGKKYPFIGVPPNYELFRDFVLQDLK
jgi:protein-disulfide isomerase